MAARSFDGRDGRRWLVWRVVPGQHSTTALTAKSQLPGGLQGGWLCFETEDEKRRLAPVPDEWEALEDERLRELCGEAVSVRRPAK